MTTWVEVEPGLARDNASPRRRGRVVPWLVLFVLALLLDVARGVNTWDEAWFLQVADRVASGQVLYRDVFFGATPLSMEMASTAVRVAGVDVGVLKVLLSVVVVAGAAVARGLVRSLGLGERAGWVAAAAVAVHPFWLASPYTTVAVLFLLVAWTAALRWLEEDLSLRWAAAAGAAAGLAFASKQNLGAYVAVAVGVTMAIRSGDARRFISSAASAAAGFAVVVALALLPVLLSGGWASFVDHAFLNKSAYLELVRFPYFGSLAGIIPAIGAGRPEDAVSALLILVPVLTVVALVAARIVGGRDRASVAMWAFTGAALAGTWPPVIGVGHVAAVIPAMYVGLAYAWSRLRTRVPVVGRVLFAAATAWVIVMLLARSVPIVVDIVTGETGASRLPHFRAALVDRSDQEAILERAGSLRRLTRTGEPFLLGPQAGFYYLLTGLRNPTPFDYPLASALGRGGQGRLAADVRAGRLPEVCVEPIGGLGLGALRPATVETAVRASMRRVVDVGVCVLYRSARS